MVLHKTNAALPEHILQKGIFFFPFFFYFCWPFTEVSFGGGFFLPTGKCEFPGLTS